jgi:CRISPR/Cas system CSM-associated protein Csm3 (group 7 of RAMP superfamily)
MSGTVDLVLVRMRAERPVSVSAPETAGLKSVDLPVAREPFSGKPYIPTTSAVGSLREHAASVLAPDVVVRLFGGGDPADLAPSLLRAMGTAIPDGTGTDVRSQTAIDRFSGSARSRSLRSREQVPVGTEMHLYLCLVHPDPTDLQALRQALGAWRPVLGGGRGVGLGECRLLSASHRSLDLGSREGLAAWLALDGPGTWDTKGWTSWNITPALRDADVSLEFTLDGDLHVGTGQQRRRDGGGGIASVDRNGEDYVVPGSALKGVFRSRAEFVLRSLGLRACASTGSDGSVPGLVDRCGSDPCLTCRIFGWTGGSAAGQRSAVRFRDATIVGAEPAERTHVAIDRFTGGQAHGLLFTEEVVSSGRITVEILIEDRQLQPVIEALMHVVAWDIHDGYVGIGHGTARGMGSLRLGPTSASRARERWFAGLASVRAAAEEAA